MKELVKKYRPCMRQTKKTTKGKAGALPPAVYLEEQDCNIVNLTRERF